MIDFNHAVELAKEYQKFGDLEIFDIYNLLRFILHSDDNTSNYIAEIAFKNKSNNPFFCKFYNTSCFVFYFKWSLNEEAVKLRKFANISEFKKNEIILK